MDSIVPANVVPWLIGALVLLPLGLRSWIHSKKLSTPTTKYFAVTAISGGLALAFYSFPSLFTTDPMWLKLGFLIGAPILYFMLIYQSYYLWYAVLQRRFKYYWLLIPVLTIGIVTAAIELHDIYKDDIRIENNELIFNFVLVSRVLQSLLLLQVFIIGAYFLKVAPKLPDRLSKLRFLSVGVFYVLVSLGTIADNLIFSGASDSRAVLIGYSVGGVAFFASLALVFTRKDTRAVE